MWIISLNKLLKKRVEKFNNKSCEQTYRLAQMRSSLDAAPKLAFSEIGHLYFGCCTNTQNHVFFHITLFFQFILFFSIFDYLNKK